MPDDEDDENFDGEGEQEEDSEVTSLASEGGDEKGDKGEEVTIS